MNFDSIISKILLHQIFSEKPIVLVDVGASGEIFFKWQKLAQRSICMAFDADDRDFQITASEGSGYQKLIKVNRIVTDSNNLDKTNFYLTHSPYCSSTLVPDSSKLEKWKFASLFVTEKTVELPVTTISASLEKASLDYIDWFKTDSQGTDLRIYLSIPEKIRAGILAADFEPGIMDAYIGEDKISKLLSALDQEKYWVSSFEVKGTQRLHEKYNKYSHLLHESPCWAGVTAIRELEKPDVRQGLLLMMFGLIEGQWGFAIEVGEKCRSLNSFFGELTDEILQIVAAKEKKTNRLSKLKRTIKGKIKQVLRSSKAS